MSQNNLSESPIQPKKSNLFKIPEKRLLQNYKNLTHVLNSFNADRLQSASDISGATDSSSSEANISKFSGCMVKSFLKIFQNTISKYLRQNLEIESAISSQTHFLYRTVWYAKLSKVLSQKSRLLFSLAFIFKILRFVHRFILLLFTA